MEPDNPLMLGNDKGNALKAIEIMLLLTGIAIISWYSVNYPPLWEKAKTYWMLSVTSLTCILASFVITKFFKINYNTPIAEKGFVDIPKKWLGGLIVFLFLGTFFFIAKEGYAIASPSFQVIELGMWGDALLSIPSAWAEDFFFFSFLAGLIFTISYYVLGKNPIPALIITTIAVPILFMTYHSYVYGFTDIVSSVTVFIFGLEQMGWLSVLRFMGIIHARHVGNNLSKIIFSQISITTFFTLILTNVWFWLIVPFVLVGLYLKFRKRNV